MVKQMHSYLVLLICSSNVANYARSTHVTRPGIPHFSYPSCNVLDYCLRVCPDFRIQISKRKALGIAEDDKHRSSHGDLKKLSPKCRGKHNGVFHEVTQNDLSTSCLICSNCSSWVRLKVVSQALHSSCVQCRQEVQNAFTAETLALAPQSDPVQILQRFKHLHCLPLQAFQKVQPLLLIGSLISCIWDSGMLWEPKKGSGGQWNWLATPTPLIL